MVGAARRAIKIEYRQIFVRSMAIVPWKTPEADMELYQLRSFVAVVKRVT